MTQLRERYHFIHNVLANFYKDTLDFFSTTLYPRFEYRVVGTYDKAVQYIRNQCQYTREVDKPMLPALVLNPSGEFMPADGNAGGRQFWRYPNLSPTLIKRLFDPIYRDDHLIVHAGFLRVKGEIELIMLLNSFYEYCDLRMLLLNIFGGLDRVIYPRFFSSFIILPESFVNYEYKNDYTGEQYKIDWASANASQYLVRSTARNELVLPLNIKPQFSLTNISDSSNRYGGTDNIAEWKLSCTVNYELEIPNYLIIESDYLAENVDLEVRYGSVYSINNDYQIPDTRFLYNFSWDWGLNSETNSFLGTLYADDATSITTTFIGDFVFKTRYFHTVTAEEAEDSTSPLIISLPEEITDPKILLVNTDSRQLEYRVDYAIGASGLNLLINRYTVNLVEGLIIELYVYEKLGVT